MANPFQVETSNSSGGDGEIPPEGNHPAALVGLIDLGTHDGEFQGKKLTNRKVLLAWELTADHRSDGSSFVIMNEYNLMPKVSGKAKLRIMLEQWRGKPFGDKEPIDLTKMLGQKCLVNVGHAKSSKGSDYAKILGITPVPRGMNCPTPLCEAYSWFFGCGEPFRQPDWLPWHYGRSVQEHIEESHEWKGTTPTANTNTTSKQEPALVGAGANTSGDEADDDIPF